MKASKNLMNLRDSVVKFCNSKNEILEFCGRISQNLEYKPNLPQKKQVQNLVNKINSSNFLTTKNILDSIIKANYELKWNTTYSEHEVGSDFIKRYCLVNINKLLVKLHIN